MSLLPRAMDERFFNFRRQATSVAGICGGVLAILLFGYRYFFTHVWSWDLLAVALTFVLVKLALMTWFYLTQ